MDNREEMNFYSQSKEKILWKNTQKLELDFKRTLNTTTTTKITEW